MAHMGDPNMNLITQYGLRLFVLGLGLRLQLVLYYRIWILLICVNYQISA